ncbi:MAG: DUF3108 domain-containing protein [Hydrogenophilaceae bacterium]|jgi:hypothetical protein|nr:DUF3108 domain-containing protein [Hydrogenophilaceae bacterium]
MHYLLGLLLVSIPLSGWAQVPQQFELVYRFTFNGQYVGNVTDRFQRLGSQQYQLTSVAKPDGKLSLLLPTLTLISKGLFKPKEIVPTSYRQVRSNAPQKAAQATLDWSRNLLTHQYKGKTEEEALPSGTQDALSQLYVFSIMEKLPDRLEMPVTNGRQLLTYQYEKFPAMPITTPLGTFETVEYRRIAGPDENAISVWVAPALHHLPLRIRVKENSGVFEQQLIGMNYRAT